MNPTFHIDFRHSAGNLHVNLLGDFNGLCAWELLKIIKQHNSSKRVFVDTQDIRQVAGEGVDLFRAYMTRWQMPRDWLYFKGNKGFKIAPNGSRVLICNKTVPSTAQRSGQSKKKLKIVIKSYGSSST